MERETYKLQDLADAAGVTPRTVRYYIAQELLPSPGRLGPHTRYGPEHLARLGIIRRLQDEGLSLAEIRERLTDEPEPMLAPMIAPTPAPEFEPMLGSAVVHARPAVTPPGTTWDRVALAPGVELHVRTPASADARALVDEVLEVARRSG
jgi:DNA-binding transcriptional MerR regulator